MAKEQKEQKEKKAKTEPKTQKEQKPKKTLYLVTGATGHLGSVLVEKLLSRGDRVRALVLAGEEELVPKGVEIVTGDVADPETLPPLFKKPRSTELCLIHCAARITIATRRDPAVWDVNVNGTKNVMREAVRARVKRVVHVSSVHAVPERPAPEVISEPARFSSAAVRGQYAKSKATAAQIVTELAKSGKLHASVVLPSGILGPGDAREQNHMVRTVRAFAEGKMPATVRGGYDIVDVRDVADGILACAEKGESGESYILSGDYITVRELAEEVAEVTEGRAPRLHLPTAAAVVVSPAAELFGKLSGTRHPLLTPYSVYTLGTNANFSHEKATRELGYSVRDLRETIRDSL